MEVVISLGIFATGVVAMFALLPQSLSTMTEASSRSIERRIAKNLTNELMLNEWNMLHTYNEADKQKRYFDAQGIELRRHGPNAIFTARIRVMPRDVNIDQDHSLEVIDTGIQSTFSLPDDKNISNSTNQHARRILIEITDVPVEDFEFTDTKNRNQFRTFSTLVANLRDIDDLNSSR